MFDYIDTKGSACHQRSAAQTAICVVTTLNHKEILFSHTATDTEKWVIQSASCTLQRFWTTSTATINLECSSEYPNNFPPALPLLDKGEKTEHTLQSEDEICIWMGYVNQLFFPREDLPRLMEGDNPRLLRVYTGIIDTIGIIGTDKGYKYSIQCRDRVRYLMDTHVTLNPFDTATSKSYMNKALGGSEDRVIRSEVILRLAQLGVGHINLGANGTNEKKPANTNGVKIDKGRIQDLGELSTTGKETSADKKTGLTEYLPPDFFYNHGTRPLAGVTFNRVLDLSKTPLFNILTSRPPFNSETVTRQYTIEDQIPIEMIKFMSNAEVYPTEVFCSHIDGNLYYVPRSGDVSGLNDARRFFRTYFYRYAPPGLGNEKFLETISKTFPKKEFNDKGDALVNIKPYKYEVDLTRAFKTQPDFGQAILNWKQDTTTLSMFTNYIVSNNSPNTKAESGDILIHMAARPASLSGLDIAARNKYIIDETLTNVSEATALAIQQARLHSRENRGASMTIIGDPSIIPGEVVQIIGNPVYAHLKELPEIIRERAAIYDYLVKSNEDYNTTLTIIKAEVKEKSNAMPVIGTNAYTTDGVSEDPGQSSGYVQGKQLAGAAGLSGVGVLGSVTGQKTSTRIIAGKAEDIAPEDVKITVSAVAGQTNNSAAPNVTGYSGPAANGKFYWPLSVDIAINSPYGMRVNPKSGKYRLHAGIDLPVPTGTPVLASNAGTVTQTAVNPGGYGNWIEIDHGGGMSTRYGHLDKFKTTVGKTVAAHELIAESGNTGGSTGPHLHFETWVGGKPLNPVGSQINLVNFKDSQITGGGISIAGGAETLASKLNTSSSEKASTPSVQASKTSAPTTGLTATQIKYADIAKKSGYIEAYAEADGIYQPGYDALSKMISACIQGDGGIIEPISGLRSVSSQVEIFEKKGGGIKAAEFSAPPGYSTHHTGLAYDFTSLSQSYAATDQYRWLKANAPKFGFMLLYANSGPDMGASFEPWHWIYVGDAKAMGIMSAAITRAKAGGADPFLGDAKLEALFKGTAPTSPSSSTTAEPATAGAAPPTASSGEQFSMPDIGDPVPDEAWKRSHFAQEATSMFRVEAVKHQFNAPGTAGYTSEVVLLSVFGA